MKQTLFSRFLAVSKRCYQRWKQNWFSYTLLLIVLLAILKKHQQGVQYMLRCKQNHESGIVVVPELDLHQINFTPEHVRDFFHRFERTAMQEQQKFGIPARIILAVALVQSEAATSVAARTRNNYFALTSGTNLASFQTAWESFRAFSLAVDLERKRSVAPKTDAQWIKFLQESKLLIVQPNFEQRVHEVLP